MSHYERPRRKIPLVILAAACWALSACTATPPAEPEPTRDPFEENQIRLPAINIGSEGDLIEVPTDEKLAAWLNTIDAARQDKPPIPTNDAWHPFTPPTDRDSVIFDPSAPTPFDVLEILAYPEGLNSLGEPVSVEVHPLCGPQARTSCQEVSWGDDGVRIPSDLVRSAIKSTEYYAIGGIVLPDGDSHPDSFMALLRKEVP